MGYFNYARFNNTKFDEKLQPLYVAIRNVPESYDSLALVYGHYSAILRVFVNGEEYTRQVYSYKINSTINQVQQVEMVVYGTAFSVGDSIQIFGAYNYYDAKQYRLRFDGYIERVDYVRNDVQKIICSDALNRRFAFPGKNNLLASKLYDEWKAILANMNIYTAYKFQKNTDEYVDYIVDKLFYPFVDAHFTKAELKTKAKADITENKDFYYYELEYENTLESYLTSLACCFDRVSAFLTPDKELLVFSYIYNDNPVLDTYTNSVSLVYDTKSELAEYDVYFNDVSIAKFLYYSLGNVAVEVPPYVILIFPTKDNVQLETAQIIGNTRFPAEKTNTVRQEHINLICRTGTAFEDMPGQYYISPFNLSRIYYLFTSWGYDVPSFTFGTYPVNVYEPIKEMSKIIIEKFSAKKYSYPFLYYFMTFNVTAWSYVFALSFYIQKLIPRKYYEFRIPFDPKLFPGSVVELKTYEGMKKIGVLSVIDIIDSKNGCWSDVNGVELL